jgi:hypothetical protein
LIFLMAAGLNEVQAGCLCVVSVFDLQGILSRGFMGSASTSGKLSGEDCFFGPDGFRTAVPTFLSYPDNENGVQQESPPHFFDSEEKWSGSGA